MLNITYQVLEVDWPLTLSAKIGGHVTWVICYLPPMEIMEFFRIADVLECCFSVRSTFLELAMVKIQMIFCELLTTCTVSIHIKIIAKLLKLGCRTALRRR